MEMQVSINGKKGTPPFSVKDLTAIKEVFETEWGEDELHWIGDPNHFKHESNRITCFGRENLWCDEQTAHDRIVKAVKEIVPDCQVLTRWTCLENLPCKDYVD